MGDEPLTFEERIGRNELRFREVNEGIRSGRQDDGETVGFVCECGAADCSSLVELTLTEYEAVRADARRFVVMPEHVYPEVERVVERHDGYWVIEKVDDSGARAEARDPRT